MSTGRSTRHGWYTCPIRGFRSGGFNGRAASPSSLGPYQPKTVDAYEAGLKADWLNGTLRTNLAAYLTKYNNKQEEIVQPAPAGASSPQETVVRNASSATIKGAEIELVAQRSRSRRQPADAVRRQADARGRDEGDRRRRRDAVARHDRRDRDPRAGQHARMLEPAGGDRGDDRRGRLAAHRRCGLPGRGRVFLPPRPGEGHDYLRRRERLSGRGRECDLRASRSRRRGGGGGARRHLGRRGARWRR